VLADFFFPFSARADRPREEAAFFLAKTDVDKLRATRITRIKEMTEIGRRGLRRCKVIRAKLPFLGITYLAVSRSNSWTPPSIKHAAGDRPLGKNSCAVREFQNTLPKESNCETLSATLRLGRIP
jgi:hypothetical protein